MKTMAELMDEYEAELVAKAKAEIAAEDAAYAALSPEEKQRLVDEREARMAALDWGKGDETQDDTDDENDDDE